MTSVPSPKAIPHALREELLAVAHRVADAAGKAALPHFRRVGLAAENKAGETGFDPVTIADRQTERAMRDILAALRPDDGILGEEEAARPGTTGLTWVIDPIDGTRSFLSGMPVWGVLVAVDAGDGPVLGVIDQPYTGERFTGGFGQAQFRRRGEAPVEIRTRPCADLSAATLFTTFPEVGTPDERAGFAAVAARVRLTRYGADCYAYALLAAGQIDLVIEAGLQPYDVQGPQAVIEGAGGVVTDWQGRPAHRGGRVLAAGDARVHAQALEILSRMPG
ncbi:histidinol-phosphatase [Halovulum dunhuangense]|uniref:Histidinol-phosphatase n=1 Tax=Halovulum dunhuangense TaxID=1505036 RepID=A0A849L5J2_9RHOB|nr:histidinol-phosphatase [Halovulum dunhuangense]NNU81401.1 histidinol-phosphatase [Halovulum dunhuangense]